MKIKKHIDGVMKGRNIDRRAFNAKLASLGLATVTLPLLPSAAQSAEEIMYFTWAGYELPERHPAYMKKYGGSPRQVFLLMRKKHW